MNLDTLSTYNSPIFSRAILVRFFQGLPRIELQWVLHITEELPFYQAELPSKIAMLVQAYRNKLSYGKHNIVDRNFCGLINIYFHNKSIGMIYLPSILHSRKVSVAIPAFLNYLIKVTIICRYIFCLLLVLNFCYLENGGITCT